MRESTGWLDEGERAGRGGGEGNSVCAVCGVRGAMRRGGAVSALVGALMAVAVVAEP